MFFLCFFYYQLLLLINKLPKGNQYSSLNIGVLHKENCIPPCLGCQFYFKVDPLRISSRSKSGSGHKIWCMARVLSFLIRYLSNYTPSHWFSCTSCTSRSALAIFIKIPLEFFFFFIITPWKSTQFPQILAYLPLEFEILFTLPPPSISLKGGYGFFFWKSPILFNSFILFP